MITRKYHWCGTESIRLKEGSCMIFVRYLLLLVLSIAFSPIWAHIIELNSMEAVFHHLRSHANVDLILFDVDQTLIEPRGIADPETRGVIGSAPWCHFVFGAAYKKALSDDEAREHEDGARYAFAPYLTYRLVEEGTADLLKQLQEVWSQTMFAGFTARSPRLSRYTHENLGSCFMSFANASLPDVAGQRYHRENGIVFCKNGRDKGAGLVEMIQSINLDLAKIIFVDDALHNLKAVEAALADAYPLTEFIGIHYVPEIAKSTLAVSLDHIKNEIDSLAIDQTTKEFLFSLHQ
jgi:hypothetical protein